MLRGKELLDSKLTAQNVLKRINDAEIFSRYVCDVKSPVKSPFREDNKPSCGFYTNNQGRLILHDFALSESWNCFNAVMKKHSLNFGKVLQMINTDFGLGLGTNNPSDVKIHQYETLKESKPNIQFNIKPYEAHELKYWSHYGITPEILIKFGVYAIHNVKTGQAGWRSTKNNPIFGYIFSHDRFKIYRPFATGGYRWLDQTLGLNVGGLPQLPAKGKLLIITKSYKDVMTLYRLGFPSICPMTETANINPRIIKELKQRFTHIISLYDYDNTGREASAKLKRLYDIPQMFLTTTKDISDHYFKYNYFKSFRVLKKHISKTFNDGTNKQFETGIRQYNRQLGDLKGLSDDIPF